MLTKERPETRINSLIPIPAGAGIKRNPDRNATAKSPVILR
jgi:hypothetical protein